MIYNEEYMVELLVNLAEGLDPVVDSENLRTQLLAKSQIAHATPVNALFRKLINLRTSGEFKMSSNKWDELCEMWSYIIRVFTK